MAVNSQRRGVGDFAVHDLADDHVVLELHERVTARGPVLELRGVVDAETRMTTAWWEDDGGQWLGAATVGCA
jgi:hypothetical protein